MPAAPHIARLRSKVGNDLLLLPSVAVLPIDDDGRVLLVRQTDFGSYGTVGGAVDEDEAPEDAARREAREEIGADVEITGLVGAIGGPEFRLTYPNGDQCAYVSIVYSARLAPGAETSPDGHEVDQVRWFARSELTNPAVGDFAQSTFAALGWITLKDRAPRRVRSGDSPITVQVVSGQTKSMSRERTHLMASAGLFRQAGSGSGRRVSTLRI